MFLSFFCRLCRMLRKFKHCSTIRRKRIFHGVRLSVTLCMYSGIYVLPLHTAIKNERVFTRLRHSDHIIRSCNRSKITYKEKIVLPILRTSHKAVYASVTIIRIYPEEALRILVKRIARRIFTIYMQKCLKVCPQALMLRLTQQIPVK